MQNARLGTVHYSITVHANRTLDESTPIVKEGDAMAFGDAPYSVHDHYGSFVAIDFETEVCAQIQAGKTSGEYTPDNAHPIAWNFEAIN